jgi:hypothetical protein
VITSLVIVRSAVIDQNQTKDVVPRAPAGQRGITSEGWAASAAEGNTGRTHGQPPKGAPHPLQGYLGVSETLIALDAPLRRWWPMARTIKCSTVPVKGSRWVARAGVEPATFHFSGERCYQLSYLAVHSAAAAVNTKAATSVTAFATPTGLEPATSAVTGRRANQLRYGALMAFVLRHISHFPTSLHLCRTRSRRRPAFSVPAKL